jgi:hypothetical protein
MRAHAWLLVGCCFVAACGSSPLKSNADGAAPPADAVSNTTDGAAAMDVRPNAGADCPPALASEAELASTPRANANLELLALKLSPGKVVADEATYQRVVRDVAAIRAKDPSLAKISFFAHDDGQTIGLVVPVETAAQMEAGTYHAWDCLNATYSAMLPVEVIRIGSSATAFVYFELRGLYATKLLAAEYAKLPGITSAEGATFGGDGPTICATAGPSTWHYVFDDASGDCPAGCIDHVLRHFATEPAGAVTELGRWSTQDGSPRPSWATELASPDRCH